MEAKTKNQPIKNKNKIDPETSIFDDVLRRMLATPPPKHDSKPVKKVSKKKTGK
jgi:hypothetical protein